MAYISLNEDFQGLGSCAQRQAGGATLAEWYKRDEGETDAPMTAANAPPQSAIRNPRSAIGEPPTLQPPFQPTAPQRPPDLFRLSPEFQRELTEKWERERKNRELTSPLPPPPRRMTLQDAIDRFLDDNLNRLMSDLRIPPRMRGSIRNAARAAIGRGAEELLDRSLTQMGLRGKAKEAIGASVRAAMRQIRVR
jgi:hypothetical protein